MSTFCGKIQEIPNISVDRFDGENFKSEAYFLSHCHTDHMIGLHNMDGFQDQLVNENKYLYASKISCTILKQMYPFIKNNLKELDLNVPITICLTNKSFSVTLIPAGHCPGSVMFLFENSKRILYTGDYRISKNDIKKFECFYDSSRKVKEIDKIYLDTTFFLKKYLNFPKREESLKNLCQIIQDWIQQGKFFYINLMTSAKYGYEYVFKEIFNKIGMPIHVNDYAFRFYSRIPELDLCVTLNGNITQIHSHCYGWKQTCIDTQDPMVKNIKVSALRWTQENTLEGMSEYESGIHYVCYSTHASYEEGVALIRFLKPKEIEICVKHDDPYVNKEIMNLIDEHLKEFNTTTVTEEKEITPKLFTIKKSRKKTNKKEEETIDVLKSPSKESCLSIKYSESDLSHHEITENKNNELKQPSLNEVTETFQSKYQHSTIDCYYSSTKKIKTNENCNINMSNSLLHKEYETDSSKYGHSSKVSNTSDYSNTISNTVELENNEATSNVNVLNTLLQNEHIVLSKHYSKYAHSSKVLNTEELENKKDSVACILNSVPQKSTVTSDKINENVSLKNFLENDEDSVLYSIMCTPPENNSSNNVNNKLILNASDIFEEEEDNVILQIINSSPNRKDEG